MHNISTLSGADIQFLLFYLGGVIYDIDPSLTQSALANLFPHTPPDLLFSKSYQIEAVTLYETGRISTDEFCEAIRSHFKTSASNEALIDVWNALLIGRVEGRIELLQALKAHYRMALLSNTNDAHFAYIQEECAPVYALMERNFFSQQLHLRKPDVEIYDAAVSELGWDKQKTLFIDDSLVNIQGAQKAGLLTFHVTALSDVEDLAKWLMGRATL